MKRLIADITDELKTVLESYSEQTGQPIGEFVEHVLRSHYQIESIRKKMKLTWQDRPPMGRPKKRNAD